MTTLPLLLFALAGDPAGARTTEAVAADYVQACFQERAMDAAFALLSDGVTFVDPTAEIWGGPTAAGVTGRDAFRKLSESWKVESSRFDVQQAFTCGPWAVYAGALSWQSAEQPKVEGLPFCTILRVEHGAVVERRDYGDYDRAWPLAAEKQAKQAAVEEVGRAYFQAYSRLDLPALEKLLAEDVVFLDPTAEAGGKPLKLLDAYELLAMLEEVQGHVRDLEMEAPFAIACGTRAVFAGTARYEVLREGQEPVRVEHPYLMALTIEDGRVVEHRRYVDHGVLWKALGEEEPAEQG